MSALQKTVKDIIKNYNENYLLEIKKAREKGITADIKFKVGIIWANALDVEKNDYQAEQWIKSSAASDYSLAQIYLAIMYEKGYEDIEPKLEDSCFWYSAFLLNLPEDLADERKPLDKEDAEIARQGIARIEANFSDEQKAEMKKRIEWWHCTHSPGLDKGIEKFADVLRILKTHSATDRIALKIASAQNGDVTAQFALGKIYTNGAVIRANKSFITAYMFFAIAALNGHEPAHSARDTIGAKLSQEQAKLASQFAKDWIKTNA